MSHRHALKDPECKHGSYRHLVSFDGGDLGRGSGPIFTAINCEKDPCDFDPSTFRLPCTPRCCAYHGHEGFPCAICGITLEQYQHQKAMEEFRQREEEIRSKERYLQFREKLACKIIDILVNNGVVTPPPEMVRDLVDEIEEHME